VPATDKTHLNYDLNKKTKNTKLKIFLFDKIWATVEISYDVLNIEKNTQLKIFLYDKIWATI
jgi:hypothetical protein